MMNRLRLLLFITLLWGCAPVDQPPHDLPKTPPKRIISTLPSITEVLFDIGLGNRIVGDSFFTKHPPEAAGIDKIDGPYGMNREKIISLKPDLVIVSTENTVLRSTLNIPLLVVDHRTLSGVLDSYPIIGAPFGTELLATAQKKQQELLAKLNSFNAKRKKPIRTLICIDRSYGTGQIQNLYVAGKDSFLSNVVEKAGGENITASLGLLAPTLSAEGVIQLAPEVIIDIQMSGRDSERSSAEWQSLGDKVPAVKHRRILTLTDDYTTIPGVRTPLLIERIAQYFETLDE